MNLYLIEAGADGPVKIGIAESPVARLKAMQTGCPVELRLLGSVEYEEPATAVAMEKWAHRAASEFRLRGEWFAPEVVLFLNERVAEQVQRLDARRAVREEVRTLA